MNLYTYKYLKRTLFISLICFYNFASAITPDEIVFNTTQEVLNRLEADKVRLEKEPEYIQTIVKQLIVPHLDFTTMASLTLGDKWDVLTDDEKSCFSLSFKNLLVERYAFVLLSYRNQNISYQSAKPIGEKDVVSIVQILTRPDVKPLTIEYPMQPEADSWKVIDLVIDDISLIRNYRKMFNSEIKHQGLLGFIYSFQECN